MHTISEPGRAALGASSLGPTVGEQLLTDGLESGPAASVRSRSWQPELVEAFAGAEVGQLKTDAPSVMIKREVVLGVEAALGQRSIPLRCRGLHRIGEIQRRADAGALPAPIARSRRAPEEVGAARGVADPDAIDPAGLDRQRHAKA
jgi:hypothetical protein